jgi:exopolyphosphatase / guanosine-5'-triphosphate,3'-diphosphate pyrophosphatase
MLKVAAIDVGSNAIRMMVGSLDDSWEVKLLESVRIPVRLGQDVFTKGTLKEASMQQTVEAFCGFQRMIKNLGVYHLRAVATSAMREARNGRLLADRIYRASEIHVDIIDGDEESRLIHLAVTHTLDIKDIKNKRTLLIDIGGGSVEITLSTGRNIIFADSYKMGTVRLLKKLETKGRSKQTFTQLVHEYAESARRRIEREIGREKISMCVGTGGNVEEIGRLSQRLFKTTSDRSITLTDLGKLIERLSQMSIAERILKLKLRPDRADVILPAAIVLHLLASEAHVKQIAIPNIGLKDGVLLDIARELSRAPRLERREQVLESALHLGRKYQFDEEHAMLTSRLAVQLFTQSTLLHDLDKSDLLLLEVGTFLHDLGHFVNTIDHDKHGQYLLKANHLIGLSEREQNIVASLVRYHRGKAPSLEEDGFKSLPQKDRLTVLKLSALLRLADSMDVSHAGHIQHAMLKRGRNGWQLKVPKDLLLEKWTIGKRKTLFQTVFAEKLDTE